MRKCDSCKTDIGRSQPVFCLDCINSEKSSIEELKAAVDFAEKKAGALKLLWQAAEKEHEFLDSKRG